MREGGMEEPYIGALAGNTEAGVYVCVLCETVLFASADKFDSKDGFPSFRGPIQKKDIEIVAGITNRDVICTKCKSRLGELKGSGANHFRLNSVALKFQPIKIEITEEEKKGDGEEDGRRENIDLSTVNVNQYLPILKNLLLLIAGAGIGAGALWAAASGTPFMCEVPSTGQEMATTTTATSTQEETAVQGEPSPQTTAPTQTGAQTRPTETQTAPEAVVETGAQDATSSTGVPSDGTGAPADGGTVEPQ